MPLKAGTLQGTECSQSATILALGNVLTLARLRACKIRLFAPPSPAKRG